MPALSRRRDVLAFGGTRSPGAATRTARRFVLSFGGLGFIAADGRRKHVERDRLGSALVGAIAFRIIARTTLVAIFAARTALAIEAIAAVLALRAFFGNGFFTGFDQLLITFVLVDLMLASGTLLLEARAIFAEHAEIMVGVLQIIFGLDTIACKLCVARHALIFLEQLGGVAALAIILAVPRLPAEILAPLSTAAAPAAALTIIDQMPTSLRSVSWPLRLRRAGRR
jgi:hypothetical protein